ncbi:MAG: type II toxin-antitoxin system VapB family antitoxin [Terracidiphilus sp.]|jgi:Arc/MetJ family transcription regulator
MDRGSVRTMLVLDDDLVQIAQELTGVVEKSALVREGLMALIEREHARRLAKGVGTNTTGVRIRSLPRTTGHEKKD